MEASPNLDQLALRLAEKIVQLLDRGGFTATYKYAVLIAIMDLCMEHTGATGEPPATLTTSELAEKIIELYWRHCVPYPKKERVLYQSTGGEDKPALIVKSISRFRQGIDDPRRDTMLLSQARIKYSDQYRELLYDVEWTLVHMPLPRLQRFGRKADEDRFLYDYHFTEDTPRREVEQYQRHDSGPFVNELDLRPGVSTALIALHGVLRPLIFRNWTSMVAGMNGIEQSDLEDFLFGSRRISLEPVRGGLLDLQAYRCFYCNERISSQCDVDHFIPWSRHPDNSIENLVATCKDCNGKKSNYLAATEHVVKWRDRLASRETDLAYIAQHEEWESHSEQTFNVARSIYQMQPSDARLWQLGVRFVKIDQEIIRTVFADVSRSRSVLKASR